MKERSANELEEEISRNEVFARRGGIAVIAGLVIEIALAFAFHEDKTAAQTLEKWSLIFATALIALGVFCELFFARKALLASAQLQRISAEKIVDANRRAAEANLELAKLKDKVAPRVLTPEMHETLKGLQGKVAELAVMWVSDAESARFAWEIATALRKMGILVRCPEPEAVKVFAGLFAFFPDAMNTFERSALSAILSAAGMLDKNRSWLSRDDIPLDLIVIFVGQKLYAPEAPAQK